MENFVNKWAPFPDDNVTAEEFDANVDKLKSLGKLQQIKGLHSNSFAERSQAIYDFVNPIHTVVRASGKDVEIPIVAFGKAKKMGRQAAGFFCSAKSDLNLINLKISTITFVATINGLTIGLLDEDGPVSQAILSISLPENKMKYIILVGRELGIEHSIDSAPGDIIEPDALEILEKILISASGALAEATKI